MKTNLVYKDTESFNEYVVRIYKSANKDIKMPRVATFQVTDDCNMACTYCYQTHKGKKVMSFETAKKFINLLLSDDAAKNPYINLENSDGIILDFIGGEPLLQVELIDKIIDYFRKRAFELDHPWKDMFKASISSNGTLYFDPKVQSFLNKHKSHLSFNITLDGNKELHDSCRVFKDGSPTYDIVASAIKDWMSRGYYIGSKITISPDNVKYLAKALQFMVEFGYADLHANCVYEEGWNLEHAKEMYKQLKDFANYLLDQDNPNEISFSIFSDRKYYKLSEEENSNWCGGDGRMIACDPDGNIYPCLRYMESSLDNKAKPLIIGHVDTGIDTTEESHNIIKCLQCITRRSQSTDECWECPINAGCAWCTAYNYQVFGDANKRATFICDMHRASSLANSYYYNSLYKKLGIDKRIEVLCPKDKALNIIDEKEYEMLINLSEK